MDKLTNVMREYVNGLVDTALTNRGNPPPLDVARRWMEEDTIDAVPCESCGEPVLDMPGREGLHVHSFSRTCDAGLIVSRVAEAVRASQHADLELEEALLGWITHKTREQHPGTHEINIEVEWEIFHEGTPVISVHTIAIDDSVSIRETEALDEVLVDWLPEYAEAAKLEAGVHRIELHP